MHGAHTRCVVSTEFNVALSIKMIYLAVESLSTIPCYSFHAKIISNCDKIAVVAASTLVAAILSAYSFFLLVFCGF